MHLAAIDIDERKRVDAILILQTRLSDALDLCARMKQAHWNVKGGNFLQLHRLFDELFGVMQVHVDLMAERLVTLGGFADGRVQTTARMTSFEDYPGDAVTGGQHLQAVGSAMARYAGYVRADIANLAELDDPGTADLLTEVSRAADRHLWLLEAHLHG